MLGGNVIVTPPPRPTTRRNPDFERYLRLEYGGQMSVAAVLVNGAQGRTRARTSRRARLMSTLQALAATLRSIATRRRRKASFAEV